ncbi:hypothetical protein LTSEINV_6146 [Salmonella enterica subsp. enterica serovar Inverness str. R8-3668]|uniref:Uncharacterized protein n=1 Tax=Salmonella enterica subsp. enterica serovar Inverness str. R8-3668 TaxID=913075 RepID=G5NLP8_SALET|nr:hypothetical protein LTSEINV_6146 [Salmonella enterica subsp. enterica serovar Inverness str. R8-3668]
MTAWPYPATLTSADANILFCKWRRYVYFCELIRIIKVI